MVVLAYRPLLVAERWILTSMTEAETARLRDLAAGRLVLEIGSAHGWSTVNMAQVADSVVAVDPHVMEAPDAAEDSLMLLRRNLSVTGLGSKVCVMLGWSRDVLPRLRGTFGGLFVDGDHSREGCLFDLTAGWQLLVPGGFLAVHDYQEWHCRGVAPAVDDFAASRPDLVHEGTVDTLWVGRKA